jgi:hypothetical protein
MKIIILIGIVMVLGLGQVMAKDLGPDELILEAEAIVMPVGRILLISRNDFLGGLKFIKNEERPEGMVSKYEYFDCQKGGFKKQREGEISYRKIEWNWWNTIKFKYLAVHPNPFDYADKLEFGKFELFTSVGSTHSTVFFWSKARVIDKVARLAPTPWRDISEVNLNEKRIQWFKHDETRKKRIIQIDKLW